MSTRRARRQRPDAIGKVPKPYRAVIERALDQGFELERRAGGHFALRRAGDGTPVFFSSSPRDGGRFTTKKLEAALKRRGYLP